MVGCAIEFSNEQGVKYTVRSVSDNYVIATRMFSKKYDKNIIDYHVEMSAFFSNRKEAFEYFKDEYVYTIIDIHNKKRGSHNLVFNVYDFSDDSSIESLMSDLEKNEVELSRRNMVDLEIKYITYHVTID